MYNLEKAMKMSLASWMIKIMVPAAIWLLIVEKRIRETATEW
jgi:hypothetical protein